MEQSKFLEGVNDWNNHLPLMWLALEETKTGDVVELGCGDGSTRQLHQYCKDNNRVLWSFDYDKEWLEKFSIELENVNHRFHYIDKRWELAKELITSPSVMLIDHSPGERRVVDIRAYCDMDGIMVIHDTQPPPTAASYGYEMIWQYFKYRVTLDAGKNPDTNIIDNRTWASAVSNTIDITKWKGQTFKNGEYILK